jgi:hypothetical protein
VHHRFRNVAPSSSGDIELQLLRNLPNIGASVSAVQKTRRDFIAITVADAKDRASLYRSAYSFKNDRQ